MKTEPEPFAVDLSNDGIFLWHRKPEKKWEFLGNVPLNTGNLRVQLEGLKKTIEGIDQSINTAVVRLPKAEVETLTVKNDPNASDSWETRIVAALETAAGVSIKLLAFDIDRGDCTSDICVAWTPMSVIRQAETFVRLIGFEPTRYTTDLNVTDFPRNPNFQIVDYDAVSEEPSQTPPPADMGNIGPETNTPDTIPNPQTNDDTSKTSNTVHKKGNSGFIWFILMFIIGALFVVAVYYWPEIQQYIDQNLALNSNQLFTASFDNTT